MKITSGKTVLLTSLMAVLGTLSACGGVQSEAKYPSGMDRNQTGDDIYGEKESIFGDGGLSLFGDKTDGDEGASGIGVNSFLWRASLDTVSFMPLASADPFGGTILTDWHSPEGKPAERFKLNVFIMGKQLRSDAVQVRVFKQVRKGGSWQDAKAGEETARKLEDAILTRARQLRIANADN